MALREKGGVVEANCIATAESSPASDLGARLHTYLHLDVDLDGLKKEWATKNAVMGDAVARLPGLRLLRQDPLG